MHNGKTVSLKSILWEVATHPLARDINYDDAALYAIRAIELVGSPLMYVNKVTRPSVKIVDYKAMLPSDLSQIRGVKMQDSNIALKYATDLFHEDFCKEDFGDCGYNEDYTYSVQSNIITTSFRKGNILISYKAMDTDEEGYPMIPDNIKVREAIRYYILCRHLEGLFDIGKITEKAFNRIEQNKDWYMGAAQTSMQLQGMDHLQSTMNSINRLLINNTAHERSFRYMQEQEGNTKYKS